MLVFQCDDLEGLVSGWQAIVENCAPQGYFDPIHPELFTALRNSKRIQWFFYTDNADGIAVRLYDRPFRTAHPYTFQDINGDPWVILRGRHLGPPNAQCKARMRGAISSQHGNHKSPAAEAPTGPGQRPVSLVTAGEEGRLHYFEDQYHNNPLVPPQNPNDAILKLYLPEFKKSVEEAVARFIEQIGQR